MKLIINRLAAVIVVFVSLVISIVVFPILAPYYLFTGHDLTGKFLP
jgi:hypothetical protein